MKLIGLLAVGVLVVSAALYDSEEIPELSSSEEYPRWTSEETAANETWGVVSSNASQLTATSSNTDGSICQLAYHAKAMLREKSLECLGSYNAFYITRQGWFCSYPDHIERDFVVLKNLCNFFACFEIMYFTFDGPEVPIVNCTDEALRPNMW